MNHDTTSDAPLSGGADRPPLFPYGFPPLVLAEELAEMDRSRSRREAGYEPEHWAGREHTLRRQADFLESYRVTLSVSASLTRLGVPRSVYDRWRRTDPDFCRNMNTLLLDLRQDLISSALARAIGYSMLGPDGNPVTDAEGRIIRQGASDSLARALLGLDKPVVQINQLKTVVFDMSGVDDDDVPGELESTTIEELDDGSLGRSLSHDHPSDAG